MKLKAFILLAIAFLVFSTPVLVALNVSTPNFLGASSDIIKSTSSPVEPCGDPIDDDPDLPDLPH